MKHSNAENNAAHKRNKIIGLGERSHKKSYYPQLKQRIKELEEKSEKLSAALYEKEVLLKEIHHRVKNNLQIINSLLKLQANKMDDDRVSKLLHESTNRIKSIAIIHESLYRDNNLAAVDFSAYVHRMVMYLRQMFPSDEKPISWEYAIQPISLTVEQAIPCGLIINELVSNALKYAFLQHDVEKKIIRIEFARCEKEFCLKVQDNGCGLPKNIDTSNTDSLGLHLVNILATGQLEGSLSVDRENGTLFTVRFSHE